MSNLLRNKKKRIIADDDSDYEEQRAPSVSDNLRHSGIGRKITCRRYNIEYQKCYSEISTDEIMNVKDYFQSEQGDDSVDLAFRKASLQDYDVKIGKRAKPLLQEKQGKESLQPIPEKRQKLIQPSTARNPQLSKGNNSMTFKLQLQTLCSCRPHPALLRRSTRNLAEIPLPQMRWAATTLTSMRRKSVQPLSSARETRNARTSPSLNSLRRRRESRASSPSSSSLRLMRATAEMKWTRMERGSREGKVSNDVQTNFLCRARVLYRGRTTSEGSTS
ncbi:hypothetical protein FGO68_gene17576 [Halteria grandinella]|uniref:Uncharacterized protein n=1 Tax=Halteria grandinella TaxID=5974 RepID=A0A8J8P019_HALGN|nr:hypothetical protein FGO68_gene17576 [Halteria grandinella]